MIEDKVIQNCETGLTSRRHKWIAASVAEGIPYSVALVQEETSK
jgi:hypothetical protein